MTLEKEFNIPAQLIIDGEVINVMVKSVKTQENIEIVMELFL